MSRMRSRPDDRATCPDTRSNSIRQQAPAPAPGSIRPSYKRAADDDAFDPRAGGGAGGDPIRSCGPPTPPEAITGVVDRRRQGHGLLQVEPAQHAVAADVGIDDRRHAGVLERQRQVARRRSRRSRPSPRSRPCRRARRCRRRCGRERRGRPRAPAPGSSPRRCPGSPGGCRRRARPRCRPCRGCRRRAAPGWSTAPRMAATAAAFTGRPAKAPFRSTTCSQAKPASCQARACAAGVGRIDRRLIHRAAAQPDALAVLQVDRGVEGERTVIAALMCRAVPRWPGLGAAACSRRSRAPTWPRTKA